MKKVIFSLMLLAGVLLAFSSCDKKSLSHTGDETGNLYGIWKLERKAVTVGENTTDTDYSDVNFYLALSNLGVPHALAKKGSLSGFDLKDVDVDGSLFTYNADKKQISFDKQLWLSEGLTYSMELKGIYDVLELTSQTLVIHQKNLLGVSEVYSFSKAK